MYLHFAYALMYEQMQSIPTTKEDLAKMKAGMNRWINKTLGFITLVVEEGNNMLPHVTVDSVKVHYAEVTSASIQMASTAQPLRDFMDALSAKMRGIKFLYRLTHEVYVYVDSCPYTLGYIGYADYSGGQKYAVFSRTIENRKFHSGNKARNMLLSTNLKVAVRNALAHLRPYSIADMAGVDADKLRHAYNTKGSDLRNDRAKAHRVLSDQTTLAAELRELIRNEYKFVHADFAEKARSYVEAFDHLTVLDSQETRHVFVRVTEDWRGQVFQLQCNGAK